MALCGYIIDTYLEQTIEGKQVKQNNLVAKHCRTFNKAVVMKDRKQAAKRGYSKHKGKFH